MAGSNDNRPLTEVIETAIERDIREDKQRRHELAMKEQDAAWRIRQADSEKAQARSMARMWSAVAFATALAAVGIGWMIWQGTKGPSAKDQQQQEQFRMCVVEKGGTWLPGDSVHGPTCVANGKAEEAR